MKIKPIIVCLMIFLNTNFYGYSPKIWSLDDCIVYALQHNLEQQNQKYNIDIQKEQWQQAKRNLIPQINFGLPRYTVNYGRIFDDVANTTVNTRTVSGVSGSLSSSIVLFESFKKWNTLLYNKIQFESSKQIMLIYKYNLAFNVMTLYNNVLFYSGNLKIVKEQQKVNLLLAKLITSQVKLGLKAKSDLYEIQSKTSEDELNVLQAKNLLKEAKLSLIQEMNLEENDIELMQPISNNNSVFPELLTIETVFKNALQFLPSVKISEYNIESSKKNLAITRASVFPKLTFSTGVNTGYSPNIFNDDGIQKSFFNQVDENRNHYISFSLNIPIFNNWSNRSRIKTSRIYLAKAEVQLKQKKQSVYKTIQKLIQKNDALLSEKIVNQKKVKFKKLTYEIAQKKYKKDMITFYELQLASNDFIKTQQEQLQINIQLNVQKKSLDFYNGTYILPTDKLKITNGY